MNIQDRTLVPEQGARRAAARTRPPIIDCDIHPMMKSPRDLRKFLAPEWREHFDAYGLRMNVPFVDSSPYPKASPALSRVDAWPPAGGLPGSDLSFMREQLLDPLNVEYGILHILAISGMAQRNVRFGSAVCGALNNWQYEEWTQKEKRLKGSINVQGEDPEAAVAEIERWAGNSDFVQVAMSGRAIEPLGRRRYWPVFEAAVRHNLPIGIHLSGENGHAPSGAGWPSYYAEHHHVSSMAHRALATSLVVEGVFEEFPSLKFVFVEGGFGWVPAWTWRLDKQWARMRDEVPHLKRPPSEYIRQNLWFTSQPVEEPEHPEDIRSIIDWIGWDRLLIATDYPHWDFDDPELAFRIRMSEGERRQIFTENAKRVYGLS
jgi:predicted TIM-barrel fold metal-dependent hydrolase